MSMSKKKVTKRKPAQAAKKTAGPNVPVSKQTAGAVTGAVIGGVVAGPVGALAAGAVGAMVGDASAQGKKPIKRAVSAIQEELTSGRAKKKLQGMGKRIKSMVTSIKKKVTKKSAAAPKKKKKAKAAAAKPKKRTKKKG